MSRTPGCCRVVWNIVYPSDHAPPYRTKATTTPPTKKQNAASQLQEETSRTGDLFYWPPGHSVRAEEDTDIVMFSPQKEHGEVIEHIRGKVGD